ncbi:MULTISPECIES: DUF6384 family protein [unclassified Devosia]|uniref:DUF6384 family protein n=1 Tax=unclassified Devosia TaxID=196773 RepID=UPI00145D979B|nr:MULTISPECIES: DUF6384 family protein [unclassified Devosia]MBJ6988338.1 hypothetical protein [Devosia sp. MC521]QMW63047.1 hypothetical protein H4N61_01395 [Devosia sp. MC521]
MSEGTAKSAVQLDEVMLAMDVVDTLRHRQDLVTRELDGAARERQLIERLRSLYHAQGIEVPDRILKEGVSALAESRFTYEPPAPSFKTTLARLYVSRKKWGRPVAALLVAAIVAAIGYFGIYQPFQHGQAEQARLEVAQGLPAQMEALRQTIFEETKVQQAVVRADDLLARGQAFAEEGNREGAEDAVERLTALRDQLRQAYTLRIVNRADADSGFWTTPNNTSDATNWYVVVEAIDIDGNPLTLPIANEENGEIEQVSMWGVRVPSTVYSAVVADKRDDGLIQANTVGRKSSGFLDVEYTMPVLGGTVTRW